MVQKQKTVLIVDDDEGMRDTLTGILKREYRVLRVSTGEAALPILNREDVDLMLLDVRLPGISGFEVLRIVKENYGLIEVIMISAINDVETAVQAMKHGAYHYIPKEFDYDQLRSLVRNAGERQDLNRQVLTLSAQVADQGDREFVVGSSKVTRDIVDLVHKVAKLSATVLILGESGTGKELLAAAIHKASSRRNGPFVGINCGAIPEQLLESELFGHTRGAFTGATSDRIGLMQSADGGTVFLDEIGDMQLPLQVKLLRVLQERKVRPLGSTRDVAINVRVISATHGDLRAAMARGEFREDLFYRLNVVQLQVPRLADRREDIPALVGHFLRRIAERDNTRPKVYAPEAMELLVTADWPGNVRQLANIVEQNVALSPAPVISVRLVEKALGENAGRLPSLAEARDEFVRSYLVQLLQTTGGNVSQASRLAQRNRTEFYKLLSRYDINPHTFKPR
jgi:two-component system, NtrC family, response regulator GlrR